jgi:hypothetical protein
MTGLAIGLLIIVLVAWVALDYSLKHDSDINELIVENNALRDHIKNLEQDLQKYRRMEA